MKSRSASRTFIATTALATSLLAPAILPAQHTAPSAQRPEGEVWNTDRHDAFLKHQRQQILAELEKNKVKLNPALLEWVENTPYASQAIFAVIAPADPRILENLNFIYTDLGKETFLKYHQFCVGAAVARRQIGVGSIQNPGFSTKFTHLTIADKNPTPDEESPENNTTMPEWSGDLENYMKAKKVTLYQAYSDKTMRDDLLGIVGINKNRGWTKYRDLRRALTGYAAKSDLRPRTRTHSPSVADWIRHLNNILTTPREALNLQEKQPWPMFDIASAPWPILMPLSYAYPLDEAQYIFEKYQGKHGGRRLHLYGPYIKGGGKPTYLQPSKWHPASWPAQITSGGVCGTMSSIAKGTFTSLGVPSQKAGQPGHSCLLVYGQTPDNRYYAGMRQAIRMSSNGAWVSWLFDAPEHRTAKDGSMTFAEYQYGLALGMNLSLRSFMDTRIAFNIYKSLSPEKQKTEGRQLLQAAVQENPYNVELWYELLNTSPSIDQGLTVMTAFAKVVESNADFDDGNQKESDEDLGESENQIDSVKDISSKVATFRTMTLQAMAQMLIKNFNNLSPGEAAKVGRTLIEIQNDKTIFGKQITFLHVKAVGWKTFASQKFNEFQKELKTFDSGNKRQTKRFIRSIANHYQTSIDQASKSDDTESLRNLYHEEITKRASAIENDKLKTALIGFRNANLAPPKKKKRR